MRYLAIGLVVATVMGGAARAATDNPLEAVIHHFVDSFDVGDMKAAAATHAAADLAIIDEVPPHIWTGPNAVQAWSRDLGEDAQKRGVTEGAVTLGGPVREEINGDRAYVVENAVYHYKLHGVAMREAALMTFALQKSAGGWLIAGWAWSGQKPEAIKP
jgi:hypothetical protein